MAETEPEAPPPEPKDEAHEEPPPEAAAPVERERVGPDYHIKDEKSPKKLIILVALLLIVGGGAAAYYQKHRSNNQKQAQAVQQLQAQQKAANSQIDSKTKSYTSPNFYLTFSYPADWTVKDNSSAELDVTSPPIRYKNLAGRSLTGIIELRVRNQQQKLSEYSGVSNKDPTAASESQKISYAKPTSNQRANTYLTFVHTAGSTTNPNGLSEVFITGDFGYQKGQAVPVADIQKLNPIISLSFLECGNQCSGTAGVPIDISLSTWQDANFSGPLLKMFESFSIN